MSKFLQANEKLTKENLYQKILEFKELAKSKAGVGNSEIEKAKSLEENKIDIAIYKDVIKGIEREIPVEFKNEVVKGLPQEVQTNIYRFMLANIKGEITASFPRYNNEDRLKDELNACRDVDSVIKLFSENATGNEHEIVEKFKEKYQPGKFIALQTLNDNMELTVKRYIDHLSEKQMNDLENKFKSIKTINDKDHNYIKRFDERINSVKDKLTDLDLDVINKANETILDPDYNPEVLESIRSAREIALSRDSEKLANQTAETSKEYNFNAVELTLDMKNPLYSYHVVKEGKTPEETAKNQADYEELKKVDVVYSDKTKNSIKEVFAKFEEYGLFEDGMVQEEQVKVYGLKKLYTSINSFDSELNKIETNQPDADPKKLSEAAKNVVERNNQVKEILGLVHKNFPSGPYDFYPGNVDVTRNNKFPIEYREDMAGISQFSGLYTVYNFYRNYVANLDGKPTLDEFLDHPFSYYRDFYKEAVFSTKDPKKTILGPDGNGLAGVQAIIHFTRDPNKIGNTNEYGNSRVGEALVCFDGENMAQNLAVETVFDKTVIMPISEAKADRKKLFENDEYLKMDKFLLVDEPQKDLKLLDHEFYNPETLKFENHGNFDEITYLSEKGQSASDFAAKLDENLLQMLSYSTQDFTPDKAVMLCQKAALKFLLVNPNEPDLETVSKLESLINDGKSYASKLVEEVQAKGIHDEIDTKEVGKMVGGDKFKNLYASSKEAIKDPKLLEGKDFEYDNIMKAFQTAKANLENNQYVANTLNLSDKDLKNFEVEGIIDKKASLDAKKAYLAMRDEYCKTKYGEDASELSAEEKDIIYTRYIEQAKREKETFAAREYMIKEGLTDRSEIHSQVQEFIAESKKREAEREQARKEVKLKEKENEAKALDERIKEATAEMNASGVPVKSNLAITGAIMNLIQASNETLPKNASNYQRQLLGERVSYANEKIDFIVKYATGLLTNDKRKELYESLDKDTKDRLAKKAKEQLISTAADRITIKSLKEEFLKNAANMSDEELKLRTDSLLTSEEKQDTRFEPYGIIDREAFMKNPSMLHKLQTELRDDFQLIGYKLDTFKSDFERQKEEVTYLADKEIDSLKQFVDKATNNPENADLEIDEAKALEYKEKLDKLNDLLTTTSNSFTTALFSRNDKREAAMDKDLTARVEKRLAEDKKIPLVKDGATSFAVTLVHKVEVPEYITGTGDIDKMKVIDEAHQEEYQELRNKDLKLSDKTKENIKAIYQKLEEFGYTNRGIIGEEGSKIYSARAYTDKLDAIKQDLEAGNNAEALGKIDGVFEEKAHIDELLKMVHERFQVDGDTAIFPGNVDVSRTGGLPIEWREDKAAISVLNGLYSTINFVKAANIDVDKFLDNPIKCINEYLDKDIYSKINLNQSLKGKSGIDALFDIAKKPEKILSYSQKLGIGRLAESLTKVEPDERYITDNLVSTAVLAQATGHLGDIERGEVMDSIGIHIDRFFYVNEPLEDATIVQLPVYNARNYRVEPVRYFDEVEYIKNDARSLSEFKNDLNDRIVESFQKYKEELSQENIEPIRFSINDVFKAAYQAASKYLLIRGELEKDDPAYDELKNFINNPLEYAQNLVEDAQTKGKLNYSFKDLKLSQIEPSILNNLDEEYKAYIEIFEEKLGKDQIAHDKQANKELQQLADRIASAEKRGSPDLNRLKDELQERVNAYKEDTLKAFREGKVTEDYLDRRRADLDSGNFKNVPPMFDADKPMNKEEFLKQYEYNLVARQGYTKENAKETMADLDQDEIDTLYERYQEQSKDVKRDFLLQSFMQETNMVIKKKNALTSIEKLGPAKEMAKEISQEAKEEKAPEVKAQENKNVKKSFEEMLDNDDLFEEKEDKVEIKEEKKVEVKEEKKDEAKVEEKAALDDLPDFEQDPIEHVNDRDSISSVKSLTEKITIDIDDDDFDYDYEKTFDDHTKEVKKENISK